MLKIWDSSKILSQYKKADPLHNTQSLIFHQKLTLLGDFYSLDLFLDCEFIRNIIQQKFEGNWKHYNPRKSNNSRYGLSLTSLDGNMAGVPDIDSLAEYNRENNTEYTESSFKTKTELYHSLQLNNIFKDIDTEICRSHIIKLNTGGHFPPHRDLDMNTFRLICLIDNCSIDNFVFLHNGSRIYMDIGKFYFLNTYQPHSVFSYCENAKFLVLNIEPNKNSVDFVYRNISAK